jgi:hypothetical protein
MDLDVSKKDIQEQFKARHQTIAALHNQGRAKKNEYSVLKNEKEILSSQMGWREKYLMGFLGGDSSLVHKMKTIKANLDTAKNNLIDIDKNINIENDTLAKEIREYLFKNSDSYQKLSRELDCHVDLYNASAEFSNFLARAKKTVTDALLLTSWDSLLAHPKAREGLNTFQTLTVEYQHKVNSYESMLKVDLLKGTKLEDSIKFSSQSIAMESFNKILAHVKTNISYTDTRISDSKKLKESIIDQVKQLIKSS